LLVVLGVAAAWLWSSIRPPVMPVPERGATLENVTIVNPGQSRRARCTVRIEGSSIAAIEEHPKEAPLRTGPAARYAGEYLLPGLIDMHVHHPPATPLGDVEHFGLLFLAHGVTAVRDTGSFDGRIFDTRRRIEEGAFPGPRIFACGPILDGDPPYWPGSRVVRTADDARQVVREVARAGANCVKTYENLTPEALEAIRAAAKLYDLPVIGHVPKGSTFSEARLADVQHLTGVVAKDGVLTRSEIRSIATISSALGIAHTPTLVFLERAAELTDYKAELDDPAAKLLPRYYREVLWNPRYDSRLRSLSPEKWEGLRETLANSKRIVAALHEAGVRVHIGTDAMNPFIVPGVSLHDEMREFLDAGFTLQEVWATATRTAGESLRAPLLGQIAVGAPADLLVFRADPTVSLDALSTLDAVIADGRLYTREVLDRALARWHEHMQDPVYDAITMRVAGWLAP
jgi:imidazolonepropionase-like amidohydrolase